MDESYRLKIEYVPLDKLKPYERNARKHGDTDIDAIAASIKRFGFKDPIGVWGKDIIVEGHGRLLAAKKLNLAEVPIIRLDDLTDEERRGYALAHNKTAELSSWDENMVDSELDELDGIFDMGQMGFSEDEQNTQDEKPEVEFSEILGEENNYLVLQFKTDIDWLNAQTVFGLKNVKSWSTRKDGKVTNSMEMRGIPRIIDGAKALHALMGESY